MINQGTTLLELAAIVSSALEHSGIVATLSGGAVVSICSQNRYESEDLDFVTAAHVKELAYALEPLGFRHIGRPRLSVFDHPETVWYLEFPPAPLTFGSRYIDPPVCNIVKTELGSLRIITPTHSVMDRLIAAAAWNDPQSLEQAILVAEMQVDSINWDELNEWIRSEDIATDKSVVEFYK
ncbi:MAG: hypothetical protein KJN72_05830 [Woeseia sp.]|nr:hypothetical protein [Woeseia sp.]